MAPVFSVPGLGRSHNLLLHRKVKVAGPATSFDGTARTRLNPVWIDWTTSCNGRAMPVITRFFGIVIAMYHREHGAPHFHARYGEFGISVDIETGAVRGSCPSAAQRLVLDWAALHKAELLENWRLAQAGLPLNRIKPLE